MILPQQFTFPWRLLSFEPYVPMTATRSDWHQCLSACD
jgi:hypothetical protein